MKNIRILLIGFVVGGGAGAKIGAYLSALLEDTISWSLIEVGASIGMGLGSVVSLVVILARAGVFSVQENELRNTRQQMSTGRV